MSIFKKALIISSAISLVFSQAAIASKRLSGAGASFPSKIYTRWFFDLAKSGGPRVNYQAVGSGSGRKAFVNSTNGSFKIQKMVEIRRKVCFFNMFV